MQFLRTSALFFILVVCYAEDPDIGYFWHFTDLHCNLDYNSTSCNSKWGNYSCDSSPDLVYYAINASQTLVGNQQPDFVIWSGDNGPHNESLSQARLVDSLTFVSSTMRRVFPAFVYILPAMGNHDVVPANQMNTANSFNFQRSNWCHRLCTDVDLWSSWIGGQELTTVGLHPNHFHPTLDNMDFADFPSANFSYGCYHSHLFLNRHTQLLLVSLNGLLWYSNNALMNQTDADPLGQLDWLNRTLAWARRNNIKVVVVSHFPLGSAHSNPQSYRFLRSDLNDQLADILMANKDSIMAALFGHEHIDGFRLIVNSSNNSVLALFQMPSISPRHLIGLGSPNPRIRLYKYHRRLQILLSYRQFYLNLDELSAGWQLDYDTDTAPIPSIQTDPSEEQVCNASSSFTQSYRLIRLWNSLVHRVDPNPTWDRYWQLELGANRVRDQRQPGYLDSSGQCPRWQSACRCDHLCTIRYVRHGQLDRCLAFCATLNATVDVDRVNRLWLEWFAPLADSTAVLCNPLAQSYLNFGILENERTTLIIIVGVIFLFLITLVGIVLVVNREVCHKRRGVPELRRRSFIRRSTNRSTTSALLMTSLNGNLSNSFIANRMDDDDDDDDDDDREVSRVPSMLTVTGGSNRFDDVASTVGSCSDLHSLYVARHNPLANSMHSSHSFGDLHDADMMMMMMRRDKMPTGAKPTTVSNSTRDLSPKSTVQHLISKLYSPHRLSPAKSSNCFVATDNSASLSPTKKKKSADIKRPLLSTSKIWFKLFEDIIYGQANAVGQSGATLNLLHQSCLAEDYYADDEDVSAEIDSYLPSNRTYYHQHRPNGRVKQISELNPANWIKPKLVSPDYNANRHYHSRTQSWSKQHGLADKHLVVDLKHDAPSPVGSRSPSIILANGCATACDSSRSSVIDDSSLILCPPFVAVGGAGPTSASQLLDGIQMQAN